VTYKELFPATTRMSFKAGWYFTGHCLALDEHPDFREQIIELFTDANSQHAIRNLEPGTWNLEHGAGSMGQGTRNPQPATRNIENFIQLCSDQLIIPAIYLKLKAHDLLRFIPEEVVQEFRKIYELNRQRNEQIVKQIDDITAALNKENIQPVFLKGTANLLDGLYSDLGERMIGDIDFLVQEADFLKSAKILEGAGYKRSDNNYFNVSRFKHYPALIKEGEQTYIEIHRLPVDQQYAASLNSELIYSNKKEIPEKQGLFVPSDEHKLIHTFIHSQLADKRHEYILADFRVLNDLYRLSKRMDVSVLAQQTNYPNEASSWLATSRRLLDLPELCPIETKQARQYIRKFDRTLKHTKTHEAKLFLKKLIHTVFIRYGLGVIQLFYSKEQRISVYKRLKDPKWYHIHFSSIKEGL